MSPLTHLDHFQVHLSHVGFHVGWHGVSHVMDHVKDHVLTYDSDGGHEDLKAWVDHLSGHVLVVVRVTVARLKATSLVVEFLDEVAHGRYAHCGYHALHGRGALVRHLVAQLNVMRGNYHPLGGRQVDLEI